MLTRTLKMSFWVTYDHLGKLLLLNCCCAFMAIVPVALAHAALSSGKNANILFIAIPLLLLLVCVVVPVAQVGLLWMLKVLLEKRDGTMALFFSGMRQFGLRAILLAIIYGALSACLLCSVWFYGFRLGISMPWLGYTLSAVALWAQAFVLLTAVLALPALVYKNQGSIASLKLAAVLTLDNPLFVFGVALHLAVVAALSVLPPVLVFFSFAPVAALQCSAYEMLSRKYEAMRAWVASGKKLDKSFVIDFGDDDDEYLCRGIRDILFPWKQ